jgi:hypothetical protein
VAALVTVTPGPAHAGPLPAGLASPVPSTASAVALQKDGVPLNVPTRLLTLTSGGAPVSGYTLDPATAVAPATRYSGSFPATTGLSPDQLSKITWVVGRGTGSVTPGVIPAPVPVPGAPAARLVRAPAAATPSEQAAGTQAAIWHYSAGTDLVPGANPPPVEALYRQLTGPANTGLPVGPQHLVSAPGADPAGNVRGTAGQLAGPFVVNPAAGSVLMALHGPAGLRFVDGRRLPVRTFRGGQKFYVDVPRATPPGSATLTATGRAQSALGRVVEGLTSGAGQLLVLAGRAPLPTSQNSTLRWSDGGLDKGVTVSPSCVAEGIGVELDNTARQTPLTAVVDKRAVTVPAGATKVVPVQVPEGADYRIPVSDGSRSLTLTGVRNCSAAPMTPVVTAAPDCAAGGMGVTIVNEDAAREAAMSVNGDPVRVPSQASKVVRVPAGEGRPYRIDVTGPYGFSRSFSGLRDCAAADAALLKTAVLAGQGPPVPLIGTAFWAALAAGAALMTLAALAAAHLRRRRPVS